MALNHLNKQAQPSSQRSVPALRGDRTSNVTPLPGAPITNSRDRSPHRICVVSRAYAGGSAVKATTFHRFDVGGLIGPHLVPFGDAGNRSRDAIMIGLCHPLTSGRNGFRDAPSRSSPGQYSVVITRARSAPRCRPHETPSRCPNASIPLVRRRVRVPGPSPVQGAPR